MKSNVKFSIVKQLLEKGRFFGAMAFLSKMQHSNYRECFQLITFWECCFTSFSTQNSAFGLYASATAKAEILRLIADEDLCYRDYSEEQKLAVWAETLKSYPAATIRGFDESLLKALVSLKKPTTEQIEQALQIISRADVKSDVIFQQMQELIETLEVPKIRAIYTRYKENDSLLLELAVVQALIRKASNVYWEHYNAGQLFARLGRHMKALKCYTNFFDKALADKNDNAIRCAMTGALQSLLYVKNIEESSKYFFDNCPKNIINRPEVNKIKLEVNNIIDSRKIYKEFQSSADSEVGYSYLDKKQLEDMRSKAILFATVHPNYNLFYHLFKICAALGLTDESKKWLKQSYETNILMFKKG